MLKVKTLKEIQKEHQKIRPQKNFSFFLSTNKKKKKIDKTIETSDTTQN